MSGTRDASMIYCPECQEKIPAESSRCKLCGWLNPNPHAPRQRNIDRALEQGTYKDQCPYEVNGFRCPLPATAAGDGKGATLYCARHSGERHYDLEAEEELRKIIAEPFKYVSARHWADERIDHNLHEHPELLRQEGEPRSEYVARHQRALAQFMAANGAVPMATKERAAMRRQVQEQAKADHAAREKARPVDDVLQDASVQFIETLARHEDAGTPHDVAMQLALEDTLRSRLSA